MNKLYRWMYRLDSDKNRVDWGNMYYRRNKHAMTKRATNRKFRRMARREIEAQS
jgi:hypothetical protein